jgi:putative aldouronate transport system substrate-binding protein
MVLELMRNNREYYDLAQYGIKGKNYDLTSDGKTIAGPDSTYYGNVSYYGMRTGAFDRVPSDAFPGYDTLLSSCASRKAFNPLQLYSLDVNDTIKNEFAACKAIYDQTRPILNLGFSENPEKDIQDYLAKMKAAGSVAPATAPTTNTGQGPEGHGASAGWTCLPSGTPIKLTALTNWC